jgi:PIN domain nuclease of toxin-antitoxin system
MGDAVKLLPDTHVLLWWMDGDQRLSRRVGEMLISADHDVYISAVCAIEMATKVSIRKLRLPSPLREALAELRDRLDALPLPVTVDHAMRLADLPLHHRDPFDRLLVAQASVEGMTLLSQDPQMLKYGIPVVS